MPNHCTQIEGAIAALEASLSHLHAGATQKARLAQVWHACPPSLVVSAATSLVAASHACVHCACCQEARSQRLKGMTRCGLQPRSCVDPVVGVEPIPYFVNLADDAALSGSLVYPLPVGASRIGRTGASKPQVRTVCGGLHSYSTQLRWDS